MMKVVESDDVGGSMRGSEAVRLEAAAQMLPGTSHTVRRQRWPVVRAGVVGITSMYDDALLVVG